MLTGRPWLSYSRQRCIAAGFELRIFGKAQTLIEAILLLGVNKP